MATTLFGHRLDDLPDYDLEVIVQNPAIAAWFENNRNRQQALQNWEHGRTGRGKLINLVKMAAKATGTIGTIYSLLNSNSERQASGEKSMVRKRKVQQTGIHQQERGNRKRTPDVSPNTNTQEGFLEWVHQGDGELEDDQFDQEMQEWENLDEMGQQEQFNDSALINFFGGPQAPPQLMEIDQGGETRPGAEAARAGGPPGGNQVSKETPISPYPSLNYGLQETHTTILPWTGWVTACLLDKDTPLQLKIRMNSPYDMLDMAVIADPAAGATYASKGFSQITAGPDGKGALGQITYPARFTGSATEATERPAWREYWAQLYQYYTVLGCEWEFIIVNPCQPYDTQIQTGSDGGKLPIVTGVTTGGAAQGLSTNAYTPTVQIPQRQIANAVAGIQYDSYSATATSTGNVMPLTYYEEVRNFKNIRWERIKDGNGTSIIKGRYRPGQIKRNIVNDGDVKTWSAVGAAPTTLSEILTLNLWQDPLNNTDGNVSVNIEVNIKYIVQFKDLKLQARYPNTITAGQDITQTLSNTAVSGNAFARWA